MNSPNDQGQDLPVEDKYTFAERVDARGLLCPMPLLKAKQALNRAFPGELIQVFATDAGADRDFPAFTKLSGHELIRHVTRECGMIEFIIKKREESGL